MAEQIPGTLFVLLVALAAWMIDDVRIILLLALGCACGWQSFNPNPQIANAFRYVALAFWIVALVILTIRIL